MLVREFDEWVQLKLSQMGSLVDQGADIVTRGAGFVRAFPLDNILSADTATLLKEADQLVASQVGAVGTPVRTCV